MIVSAIGIHTACMIGGILHLNQLKFLGFELLWKQRKNHCFFLNLKRISEQWSQREGNPVELRGGGTFISLPFVCLFLLHPFKLALLRPQISLFSAQISPARLQISSYYLKISLSSDLDFSPINLLLSPNRYCMSPSDLTFTLKSLTRASSDSWKRLFKGVKHY